MKRFEGLNEEMVKFVAPNPGKRPLLPALSKKAQVALMCRMLFKEGWNEHIAGHITLRLDNGHTLSNPWELAWDEVTASDIVTLDEHGKVIDSDWNITPAIGLHLQLHAARPDVAVVIHNHAHWSGIWANMHKVPPIYDQTGAHVSGELKLYNEYEGRFDDDNATQAAVDALADAPWALLANHGSLVVGKDLRQAHLRAITLEWRSKRAYEVALGGGGVPMPDEEAKKVSITDDNGFPFLWEAMARREIREDPGVLD